MKVPRSEVSTSASSSSMIVLAMMNASSRCSLDNVIADDHIYEEILYNVDSGMPISALMQRVQTQYQKLADMGKSAEVSFAHRFLQDRIKDYMEEITGLGQFVKMFSDKEYLSSRISVIKPIESIEPEEEVAGGGARVQRASSLTKRSLVVRHGSKLGRAKSKRDKTSPLPIKPEPLVIFPYAPSVRFAKGLSKEKLRWIFERDLGRLGIMLEEVIDQTVDEKRVEKLTRQMTHAIYSTFVRNLELCLLEHKEKKKMTIDAYVRIARLFESIITSAHDHNVSLPCTLMAVVAIRQFPDFPDQNFLKELEEHCIYYALTQAKPISEAARTLLFDPNLQSGGYCCEKIKGLEMDFLRDAQRMSRSWNSYDPPNANTINRIMIFIRNDFRDHGRLDDWTLRQGLKIFGVIPSQSDLARLKPTRLERILNCMAKCCCCCKGNDDGVRGGEGGDGDKKKKPNALIQPPEPRRSLDMLAAIPT